MLKKKMKTGYFEKAPRVLIQQLPANLLRAYLAIAQRCGKFDRTKAPWWAIAKDIGIATDTLIRQSKELVSRGLLMVSEVEFYRVYEKRLVDLKTVFSTDDLERPLAKYGQRAEDMGYRSALPGDRGTPTGGSGYTDDLSDEIDPKSLENQPLTTPLDEHVDEHRDVDESRAETAPPGTEETAEPGGNGSGLTEERHSAPEDVPESVSARVPEARPVGILKRKAESSRLDDRSGLVSGGGAIRPKVSVPIADLGIRVDDPETATELWSEFQRVAAETTPGYEPPSKPTGRELANCKTLLTEYRVSDIKGLFRMIAERWAVVREKWPHLAKTPMPSFYVAFTLRRDLIPLVQSKMDLTSRSHRVGDTSKDPDIGWGDE